MSKPDKEQKQAVAEGGAGIQAGGDLTVNVGPSFSEIDKIVVDRVKAEMIGYSLETQERIDRSLERYRTEIHYLFERKEMRREAFRDPDFVYLLGRAGHFYARAGEDQLLDILTRLLVLRSKEIERSRLSLILNEAVEKSAVLTAEEFAAMALVFLVRYCSVDKSDIMALSNHLNTAVVPLIDKVSTEQSCGRYIQSHGCGSLEIFEYTLENCLLGVFGGLFCYGFADKTELYAHLPNREGLIDDLIVPCVHEEGRIQIDALNKTDLLMKVATRGLTEEEVDKVYKGIEQKYLRKDRIIEVLEPSVPRIQELFDLWDSSYLKKLSLTTNGLALGYSYLRPTMELPEISVWIK